MIYAGIDEAGYGPTLGPFTLGLAAFAVPDDEARPPDLYAELTALVARASERSSDRITVADSKALYSSGAGLGRLERAFYPFHLAQGKWLPSTLPELLGVILHRTSSDRAQIPWYQDLDGGASLPRDAAAEELLSTAAALRELMTERDIDLRLLLVGLTTARDWNNSLERTENKSVTAFRRVRRLLVELWEAHCEGGVVAHVDKQGGRDFYLPLLQEVFPALSVRSIVEGKEASRYEVVQGDRWMQIHFEPRAEERHLPVALASIGAKYVRELLMERFNAWFSTHAADLRPTAGYPQDARRWLEETAELRQRLQISNAQLIRKR